MLLDVIIVNKNHIIEESFSPSHCILYISCKKIQKKRDLFILFNYRFETRKKTKKVFTADTTETSTVP